MVASSAAKHECTKLPFRAGWRGCGCTVLGVQSLQNTKAPTQWEVPQVGGRADASAHPVLFLPAHRRAPDTLPFLGNGIKFLQARQKLFAWFVKCERQFGYETFQISVPTLPPGVVINDPRNVEFVLKNEGVFSKGSFVKGVLWDLFGEALSVPQTASILTPTSHRLRHHQCGRRPLEDPAQGRSELHQHIESPGVNRCCAASVLVVRCSTSQVEIRWICCRLARRVPRHHIPAHGKDGV